MKRKEWTPKRTIYWLALSGIAFLAALFVLRLAWAPKPDSAQPEVSTFGAEGESFSGTGHEALFPPEIPDGFETRSTAVAVYQPAPPLVDESEKRQGTESIVFGRILDSSDNPLGGTKLSVYGGRDQRNVSNFFDLRLESHSRPDGTYEIRLESPFHGWLLVDKPGFAVLEARMGLTLPGVERRDFVLLEAAEGVFGQVLEEGTGRPLEGVMVTCSFSRPLRAASQSHLHGTALTDSHGEFSFSRLPIGDTTHLFAVSRSHLPEMKSVRFARRDQFERIEIRMKPAKKLQVRAVDEDGRPVSGARVRTRTHIGVLTNEEGVAEVLVDRTLTPSAHELLVDAEGYLEAWLEIDPSAGEVEVTLRKAPRIHIEVFNQGGEPLPDTSILLWAGKHDVAGRGITDERGVFDASPSKLPVEKITVGNARYLGREFSFPSDSTPDHLVVILESGNAGVAGQVLSAQGPPAKSFRIWLRRQGEAAQAPGTLTRYFSEADGGRFQILDLPEGLYDLTASSEGPFVSRHRAIGIVRNLELKSGQMLSPIIVQLQSIQKGEPQ